MNKSDFVEELKNRTKKLAVTVILFFDEIKKTEATRIIGRQLIRSVTSTAANYRAFAFLARKRSFLQKYL
jgi:four helix bundle protein